MSATLELLPNGRYVADRPRPKTTLGESLFHDPLASMHCLGDIRARLELKAAACAATGRFNGSPVHVNRIRNPKLRALIAAGMIWQDWSVKDLLACTDGLSGPADNVLIATLEKPVWGADDLHLLDALERMEKFQDLGLRGGIAL